MHAKSGLRVVLKWKIYRPDSVIAAVIPLEDQNVRISNTSNLRVPKTMATPSIAVVGSLMVHDASPIVVLARFPTCCPLPSTLSIRGRSPGSGASHSGINLRTPEN